MNNRLQQFLLAENISQSQLADIIGVARASVSHIIAGRNKPGYDFIAGMAAQFPSLNLEWLVTGKGKMYKIESRNEVPARIQAPGQVPENPEFGSESILFSENEKEAAQENSTVAPPTTSVTIPEEPKKSHRIKKVVIFYEDSTFEEIEG